MGRDKQQAKIPFAGKAINFYQPNDAQATIVVMTATASKGNAGPGAITRFFKVVEALTVDPEDWTYLEDLMINGEIQVKDFFTLVEDLFNYDWPETEDAAE
jgi:hypothetical protein